MKQIYTSLVFITFFSVIAVVACLFFANGYDDLHASANHEKVINKIQSTDDIKLLKEMALHMQESYALALEDHASLYSSLVKIFAALAVLSAITVVALYKYNASNKALKFATKNVAGLDTSPD